MISIGERTFQPKRKSGNRHDAAVFKGTIEHVRYYGQVTSAYADETYDADRIHDSLTSAHIEAVAPSRRNRREPYRHPYSKYPFRLRHRIKNYFRKLFDIRRGATSYDKLATGYLSFGHLVGTIVL